MAGWNKAHDEFDNRRAAKDRGSRLASQAMRVVFDSLDKPVQQFVRTLHDHNQWPTTQKRVTKETKGLFRTKQETQLVTEQHVLHFEHHWENAHFPPCHSSEARLTIFASGLWDLAALDRNDYGLVTSTCLVVRRTSDGLEQGSAEVLLSGPALGYQLRVDIDNMESHMYPYVRHMANYLMEKGLPLPSD